MDASTVKSSVICLNRLTAIPMKDRTLVLMKTRDTIIEVGQVRNTNLVKVWKFLF